MIRPIISNEAFTLRSYGGIINYFLQLLPALRSLGVDPSIAAPIHRVEELDDSPFLLRPSRRVPESMRWINTIANTTAFAQELATARTSRSDDVVLHRSYFYRDRLQLRLPSVITVYDLIAELLPDPQQPNDKLVRARAAAISEADHVIAISEKTKQDVVDHFGIDPSTVTVTSLASPLAMATGPDQDDRNRDSTIIFVGVRGGYKNFETMLDALSEPAIPRQLHLVAFGGGEFAPDELAAIDTRGLSGRVHHVHPRPGVLDALYRRSLAFVCPSRYEGFGLPVLEAMERGCPTVIASAGSLPEVAGTAALSFDPNEPSELAKILVDLMEQPGLQARLASAGRERSSHFTWKSTAESTMVAYRSALDAAS